MDLDLAGLIKQHQGDRSYIQLSRDCGGVPKSARLHQLVTEPQKTFPEPPTLAGLARGLGVPLRVVVHAAARSVGLDLGETPTRLANLLPVDADRIPERGQDAVLSVVRAMLAREYEVTDAAQAITAEAARGHLEELDERARRDLERLTGESLPKPSRGGRRGRKEREVS